VGSTRTPATVDARDPILRRLCAIEDRLDILEARGRVLPPTCPDCEAALAEHETPAESAPRYSEAYLRSIYPNGYEAREAAGGLLRYYRPAARSEDPPAYTSTPSSTSGCRERRTSMAVTAPFWAIVELFGHQQVVGEVSEATIGGVPFVQVDVPAHGEQAAYTRYFGNGAIYSLTPVSQDVADAALRNCAPRPAWAYTLPALTAGRSREEYDGDEEDT
jgi:hypothetical protein